MVMMITRFHRLIQNKVVWILFSLMVVISFVFWGMASNDSGDRAAELAPGTLNGKPVSYDELRGAKTSTYISLALQTRRQIPRSREVDEQVENLAWRRIVSLATAKELGFSAGKGEIQSALAGQASFTDNGNFSMERYRNFVQGYLANLLQGYIPLSLFENHVRQEIGLNKLQAMVGQTVLISPAFVRKRLGIMTDGIQIEYALLEESAVTNDVAVTEENARAFFEENKEVFMVPRKIQVEYVRFPIANYLDEAVVDEQSVTKYYEDHRDDYLMVDTNALDELLGDAIPGETEDAEPETGATESAEAGGADEIKPIVVGDSPESNDVAGVDDLLDNSTDLLDDVLEENDPTAAPSYQPLDEVREEIVALLKREMAQNAAYYAADTMVVNLVPEPGKKPASFQEQAKELGLEVASTEPFSEIDFLPEFGLSQQKIIEQAFQLSLHPDEYFSNAIVADNSVYVLALVEEFDERLPEFEEAREEVMPLAYEDAVSKELERQGKAIIEEALENIRAGKPFGDIARKHNLDLVQPETFTLLEGLDDPALGNALMSAAADRNRGEFADPVPVDGGALLVYVVDRTPMTEMEFQSRRVQLVGQLRQEMQGQVYADFQEQLLRDADFEERAAEQEEEDEEEEGLQEEDSEGDDESQPAA